MRQLKDKKIKASLEGWCVLVNSAIEYRIRDLYTVHTAILYYSAVLHSLQQTEYYSMGLLLN